MKSLVSAAVHVHSGSPAWRRPLVRLLSLGVAGALAVALIPGAAIAAPAQPHVVAVTTSGDWTQFRHDASHSGSNAAESIISVANAGALGLRWKGAVNPNEPNSVYRIIESSPAVANGVVYIGSRNSGQLFAFAVGCGVGGAICQPLWSATTDNWWISSSPAIYSNGSSSQVIIGGAGGKLWAFDAAGITNCSGIAPARICTALWTGQTGAAITGSPTVYNGVVYVGSNDKKLYAFDPSSCGTAGASCAPLWTGTTTGAIHSSPAVAPAVAGGNPIVYLASDDGTLYAWDTANCASAGGSCEPLWTATPPGGVRYSPAVANGVVYIADGNWYLDAYDAAGGAAHCTGSPKTCTPLWSRSPGEAISSSPAIANGMVYFMGAAGHFYAVSAADGSFIWGGSYSGDNPSSYLSSPAVANGVVYVADQSGKLSAYGAAGATNCDTSHFCDPLWTYATGSGIESSPAVANGVVYVGSDDGYLYAFGLPATAKTLAVSGIVSPYVAGAAHSVTVKALDVYGHVAAGYRGKVHFTTSDPKASMTADYTFTGTDKGVHVFSYTLSPALVLKTAGTQWVRATDTATTSITGSQSAIVVNPGSATHLAVSGLPSPTVAGVAHNFTVKALDAYGNTATGYTGTIHFTSSDGAATLPADYKFTSSDKGVHTFSVILRTPGTQSVTATDTVTASISGSQSIVVAYARLHVPRHEPGPGAGLPADRVGSHQHRPGRQVHSRYGPDLRRGRRDRSRRLQRRRTH